MSRSLRSLLKSPLFFGSAVATLALGIGASTTVFTVLHSVALRPLAFAQSQELVLVRAWKKSSEMETGVGPTGAFLAGAEFSEFARRATSYSMLAAMRYDYANLTKIDAPTQITIGPATADFFTLLGVPAKLGRTWSAPDCQPGAPPVVVFSHPLWETKFGSEPGIVGKTVTLNDTSRTVIGVMPKAFKDPFGGLAVAWVPIAADSSMLSDRVIRWFATIGRLKHGVSQRSASDEAAAFAETLGNEQPDMTADWRWTTTPLQSILTERTSGGFVAASVAALALLLITCANVAALMVARAQQRRRETAIRSALGATFRDLTRESLREGSWIALFGGVLGITLAYWGVELTKIEVLPSWFPRLDEIQIRPIALGFVVSVGVLTALACGLVPLLYRKEDVSPDLRAGGAGLSAVPAAARVRQFLVIFQIALAVALLSIAGLALRSFSALRTTDLGARTEGILALTLNVRDPRLKEIAQYSGYYESIIEEIRGMPGITQVGISSTTPFLFFGIQLPFTIEGRASERGREPNAYMDAVNADYFSALGISARSGRLLQEMDDSGAAPVCVVNETFARLYFPDGRAIGRQMRLLAWDSKVPAEIVGVVGDFRRFGAQSAPAAQVYVPYQQKPWNFSTLLVRSSLPADSLQKSVQKAIWNVNPNQPVNDVRSLDALVDNWMELPRVLLRLFTTFAVLAVTLAGVGVYGLMAFVVTQRTREFGIRLALGAKRSDILARVLREGGLLVAIGALLGLGSAVLVAQSLRSLIFGVTTYDPVCLMGGALAIALVALAAAALPARRATRVDPVKALRAE